jgi:hypothetical protein
MNIVFVETRYQYDSYTDLRTLAKLSGFDTCYVDEVDIRKPNVYIVSPHNGEWNPHLANQAGKPHNAYLVLWCLERPSGAGGVGNYARSNRSYIYDRYLDDVWVSDKHLASEASLTYVPLGSDYGLGEPGAVNDKIYDFTHMSAIVDRRARVYNMFHRDSIGPNCWPWDENPSRDEVLKKSRFALNVHQDQYPFQEPLRLALFAAYGLPVLTEEIVNAIPWNEDICVFNPYDGIAGRLRQMIDNPYDRWYDMGMRARDYICKDFNFKKMVLKAIGERR